MTEKEKMLTGALYDPSQEDLPTLRVRAHDLCREYNLLSETDAKRELLLQKLLPKCAKHSFFQGPIQFDYGCFTSIGEHFYANFNFTCLDCAPVTIGNHVFIGPNVSLLTPVHPFRHEERNPFFKEDGSVGNLEYARPIVIEDNCWIAGSVTICGGVTIGAGSIIGAGSVVTRDIPANTLAAGNPCRAIRKITEKDSMSFYCNLSSRPV